MTQPMDATQIDELLAAITQGEWEVVAGDNCGTYGNGPDTHEGFVSYAVVDSKGRTIVDTYNSTVSEVYEESDEDGHSAWDEVGRRNTAFIAATPALIRQLRTRLQQVEGERDAARTELGKLRAALQTEREREEQGEADMEAQIEEFNFEWAKRREAEQECERLRTQLADVQREREGLRADVERLVAEKEDAALDAKAEDKW